MWNFFKKKQQKTEWQLRYEERINRMTRRYEFIYPDYGGNTFLSIIVWEGPLEVADTKIHIGWHASMRVMEARYVIMGRTHHSVTDAAELNGNNDEYNGMLIKAHDLQVEWMKEFRDFKSKYDKASKEAHDLYPDLGYGLSWDQEKKEMIIYPPGSGS